MLFSAIIIFNVQKLTITSTKNRELINITKIIDDLLMKNGYSDGLCVLFCTHTTCALTIADLDPGGTDEDYLNAYQTLIPKLVYKHPHNPGHFGDNLLSSTIGVSLVIPVQSASMVLGSYQKVVLFEFAGPRERHITLNFVKDPGGQNL